MHILIRFMGARGFKFWFFGNNFLNNTLTKKNVETKVVDQQNTNTFTSVTFSPKRIWGGARACRNKLHTFKNFPKAQIIFKNWLNSLLGAVVFHCMFH